MEHLFRVCGDRVRVVPVEAYNNPETIAAYHIRGLPALLFFHRGQLIHQQMDRIDEAGLVHLVETLLREE